MIINENYDENPLLQTNYVNLNWMKSEEWVIRLETRKYLEKEIRYNKNLRMIVRDLTRLYEGKSKQPKFLINDLILEEFKKVVKFNLNILIHIAGKTGSGKSLLAQKLGFLLVAIYLKHAKEYPTYIKDYSKSTVFVEFTIEAANNRLKSLNPGDILIRDEQSKSSGEGSRIENDKNENLRKAIRGNNINFIDCQPGIEVSSTLNFVIMTLGFNTKSKVTAAIVFVPMAGTKMDQTILHPIGYILLKLHDNKLFLKSYEKQKQEYNDNLQSLGGTETISLKEDEIIYDSNKFIKYLESRKMFPENTAEFDLMYALAGIPTRSSKHPKRVIAYTRMMMKQKGLSKSESKSSKIDIKQFITNAANEENPMLNFEFNLQAALETYESDFKERDIRIYNFFDEGQRHTDQAIRENLSDTRIRQIIKKVEGYIDYLVGHSFEIHCASVYEKQGYEILTDLEKLAAKGDPDLIVSKNGIIEILSLKVSKSMKKEVNPLKDCKPEIQEFIKRKENNENVKLFLEFINTVTKDHRKIELNEKNLQHLKSIPLF